MQVKSVTKAVQPVFNRCAIEITFHTKEEATLFMALFSHRALHGLLQLPGGFDPSAVSTMVEDAFRSANPNMTLDPILNASEKGLDKLIMGLTQRIYETEIEKVTKLISDFGHLSGADQKQWLLSRVANVLLGDRGYENWKKAYKVRHNIDWFEGEAP